MPSEANQSSQLTVSVSIVDISIEKDIPYMKSYHQYLVVVLCLLLPAASITAQMYTDAEDLADAVNAADGGGVFVVQDGTYHDFEATFEVVATAGSPIVVKAETVGGVVLTGESFFVIRKSAFVTLEGFVFDSKGEDTLVKLEGSNNIRITRNVFELETTESIKWVFVGGVWNDNTFPFQYPSHNNRIDHNIFQNKNTPGHYITIDGSFDASGSEEVYYQSQYDRIDHNHFRSNGPRAVNEQESIRIGWSEMSLSSGNTIVEHNLFEDCDGDPEIVSVKSCDNIIRHNTFRKSYGTLSLRHGNRNRVEGNYFFGDGKPVGTSPAGSSLYTGGIRIYGTDHVIINNYMEGLNGTRWDAPITLTLGDAVDGESSNLSKHFRAERVTIAFNTLVDNEHGIEIGFDNNDNYNKDLEDITIANNLIRGSHNSLVDIVDSENDQGENITWIANLMYPMGGATLLNGATITTFDIDQVVNEDPMLEFDSTINTWRTTAATPLYNNFVSDNTIAEDIDGQERPEVSNPGADHYSLATVRYRPLTAEDVGPYAGEGSTTAISVVDDHSDINVYPLPAYDKLMLAGLGSSTSTIQIVNTQGQRVLEQATQTAETAVDVSQLLSGVYYMTVTGSDKAASVHRIVVQH